MPRVDDEEVTFSSRRSSRSSTSSTREEIVRAYGTIASQGVSTGRLSREAAPDQVEFTLNVYKVHNGFEGSVYIVNYDTRRKLNSNTLVYFSDNEDRSKFVAIFRVTSDDGTTTYEMMITGMPRSSCMLEGAPKLYAYVAPLGVAGLNIGGELESGEITFL